MTFHINHPEFEKLVHDLAAQTGETPEEAVINSLRARMPTQYSSSRESTENLIQKALEIGRHCAALPKFDHRSADEILGYDENGLPS